MLCSITKADVTGKSWSHHHGNAGTPEAIGWKIAANQVVSPATMTIRPSFIRQRSLLESEDRSRLVASLGE